MAGDPLKKMLGILVHGDNHFIVRGPLPNCETAYKLTRHWTYIRIGASVPDELKHWEISTKEYRENLEWAVIVPGESSISEAVSRLLEEMKARGVRVHDAAVGY